MTVPLAGFDFTLEFSEALATKALSEIFRHGVSPTRYSHGDTGQPGILTTRQKAGGRLTFQNYLIDVEAGYEFSLSNPGVKFNPSSVQTIEITLDFSLKFFRNLVSMTYDDANTDSPLANDPGDVKQNIVYAEEYRTAPATDPYPGTASPPYTGDITIVFPITQKSFGMGRRASAETASTSLHSVARIRLDAALDPRFKAFLEAVGAKALTELIRREVDDYDMTPLFGDLSAFGLMLRDPVVPRLGKTSSQSVLVMACNESMTVGNGASDSLPYLAQNSDFAVSFRESMFAQLIISLYSNGVIPKRYSLDGGADPNGQVLLEPPRIAFTSDGLELACRLRIGAVVVTGQAIFVFDEIAVGELHVRMLSLVIDIDVQGLGVGALVNTVSFHLLGAIVGGVLASILNRPINNSLDAGLQTFLQSGRLAFSFNSPIRGTPSFVNVLPTAFVFAPGICTLRGAVNII